MVRTCPARCGLQNEVRKRAIRNAKNQPDVVYQWRLMKLVHGFANADLLIPLH